MSFRKASEFANNRPARMAKPGNSHNHLTLSLILTCLGEACSSSRFRISRHNHLFPRPLGEVYRMIKNNEGNNNNTVR